MTSVALLRRRHWAQRAFSALLALCAVVLLGSLGLGWNSPEPLAGEASDSDTMLLIHVVQGASVVLPLLGCATLLWIWVRLQSAPVRAEFRE